MMILMGVAGPRTVAYSSTRTVRDLVELADVRYRIR